LLDLVGLARQAHESGALAQFFGGKMLDLTAKKNRKTENPWDIG